MELITLEQWKQWNGQYALLPYIRKRPLSRGSLLPLFWDRFWQEASSYACILESGKGGRYTLIGVEPVSVIIGKGNQADVFMKDSIGGSFIRAEQFEGSPIHQLRRWMGNWKSPKPEGLPDCIGGSVGLCSYDMARSLERLPLCARDDLDFPDFVFQRFEQLWIVDQLESAVYFAIHVPVPYAANSALDEATLERLFRDTQQRAIRMADQWTSWMSIGAELPAQERHASMRSVMEEDQLQIDVENLAGLKTSMNKKDFEAAVRSIQQYIREGDVFQVNLSLRQSRPTHVSPEALYEWLRLVNPSPYMGIFRTPSFCLVSASPELLVKLDNGKLSTRPIAGTRRRGRSPEEDSVMENELRSNEKERAEHIMLVDLERNDLGRVAKYGTVHVPELMTVERYSHVMHLVSQVEGQVASGNDALDVLAAVFPGGTITGAPKIRTMEIIEELEPVRRGPYTGSVGWIDYAGNMEFNIVIRTIAALDGVCHIQAGAGVVIDSDPEREFYECLNKAKALWKAVQYGERQEEPK